MCFSLNGRWQTRLVSLLGPLCLAGGLAIVYRDRDYWLLFALMAVVGLVLDMGVYGWLIGYQPRWLTIGLGIIEFLLLKWIVEWPYPFDIRLHTRQALAFYVVAWLLTWITTQLIVPALQPRWAEEGGELRGILPSFRFVRNPARHCLTYRREVYLTALAMTVVTRLPWLVGLAFTPAGRHFTGLLLADQWHLDALAAATAASVNANSLSPEGLVGVVAGLGRWPVLDVYQLLSVVATFVWFLGMQVAWPSNVRMLTRLGFAALVALVVPPMILLLMAVAVWGIAWTSIPDKLGIPLEVRWLELVAVVAAIVWGFAWVRVSLASPAYLGEAQWQALTWLRQSAPQAAVVAAPQPLSQWIPALSGQRVAATPHSATLLLTEGSACRQGRQLFAHGSVCIMVAPGPTVSRQLPDISEVVRR